MTTTVPDFMPVLDFGMHNDPSEGGCAMEIASFLAGERWSDNPVSTAPILAHLVRNVNDSIGEGRQMLAPMIPDVIGTRTEDHRVGDALLQWMMDTWGTAIFGSIFRTIELSPRNPEPGLQFLRDAIEVAHAALGDERPEPVEVDEARWAEARELVAA